MQTSNFIGESLDLCRELGFRGALLVGHIGKLVKLAGGMLNTHSKYGDCRMELLAAHAGRRGWMRRGAGRCSPASAATRPCGSAEHGSARRRCAA